MASDCGPESRIMAIPPWPSGVAMAAIVSAGAGILSLLEEDTGFHVTFALEIMPQIRGRIGRQLRGQFVQPRKDGPQVGLGLGGSHLPGGQFQFQQRIKNLTFRLSHRLAAIPSHLNLDRNPFHEPSQAHAAFGWRIILCLRANLAKRRCSVWATCASYFLSPCST